MFSVTKPEFQIEKLSEVLPHIKGILADNHAETGVYDLPFNPDYDRYLYLDSIGQVLLMTARKDTELVGFAVFFLDYEIQQKELRSATTSINFVRKEHRGIGLAFMRYCDQTLKHHGINSVWRQASAKLDIGKVYERMGYTRIETSYLKRL
jgi:GNAT superfamily N-acetyltransferase